MNAFRIGFAGALCAAVAVGGCRQGEGSLTGFVDSAGLVGRAEAAPAAASAPPAPPSGAKASPKQALWREYPAGEPLPQGVVPMQSLAPLVRLLKPGVVNIYTTSVVQLRPQRRALPPGFEDPFEEFWRRHQGPDEGRRQSLGSGFIINPDGYVITNNHVVENATEIRVKLADGREFEARVVGRDPRTDVALLRLETSDGGALHDLPTVYLGDSEPLDVGDFVLAVGNPFGLDHSVSLGIVSAKERVIGAGPYDDFIQTDAAINPGNSGGPLFNTRGEVVGVNTAIVAQGQGIGFAVPINMVKELLPPLLEKGRVVRGWLGAMIQEVTPEIARSLRLESAHGALVAGVTPDSPAEQAALRAGDVVIAVNGRKVDSYNQLSRLVAFMAPGSKAKLAVLRDGKPREIGVTIGERPEDEREVSPRAQADSPAGSDRLGLTVQPANAQKSKRKGADGGVQIAAVDSEGAAGRAGARVGDVIVELQRQPVRSMQDYAALVGSLQPGDMALMRLQRENAAIYVAVRVPR